MRMLFLGAGGTGGYFGGRAAEAGADVTFLVREPRAARLREQGLRIKSPCGDSTLHPPVVTAQSLHGHYDVVVLSCKAYDLDDAIAAVTPAMGPQSAVLPLLNGMAHYDTLEQAFGAHRVLGGLCQIGATLGPDGEVIHMGKLASFTFGERSGEKRSARCIAIERALANVNFTARLSEDVHQDNWEKWVFLCTLAAATCLMRGTVGEIASTDAGASIMRELLAETLAVAAASGYPARPEAEATARARFAERESAVTASMFRDLKQGARVEADHIVGDMIRRATALGVATPYLRVAYTHLQVYQSQAGARRSP